MRGLPGPLAGCCPSPPTCHPRPAICLADPSQREGLGSAPVPPPLRATSLPSLQVLSPQPEALARGGDCRSPTASRQPAESCCFPPKTVNFKPDSVDCFLCPLSPLPQPCPVPEPFPKASRAASGAFSLGQPDPAPRPRWDRARPGLRSKLAFVASPQRNKAFDFACFLA